MTGILPHELPCSRPITRETVLRPDCLNSRRARYLVPALDSRNLAHARKPPVPNRSRLPSSWPITAVVKQQHETSQGLTTTQTTNFPIKQGKTVEVQVTLEGQQYHVVTQLKAKDGLPGCTPHLHWGLYRTSSSSWHHPEEVRPPGSTYDPATRAVRTPMTLTGDSQYWTTRITLPKKLAPVHLGCVIYFPDHHEYLPPLHGLHHSISVGMSSGQPEPMGATLLEVQERQDGKGVACRINFAVYSRHASSISLCLCRRDGTGYMEVGLHETANKTGDIWHIELENLKDVQTLCYGWRAQGDLTWTEGGRFHPGYILLDPYAPQTVHVALPDAAYKAAPMLPPEGKPQEECLLGSLAHLVEDFDWRQGYDDPFIGEGDGAGPAYLPYHRQGLEESVVLELDIKELTSQGEADQEVPWEHQGTYLGVIDRLPSLVKTGANVVLLPPLMLSKSSISLSGRSPVSYFAPEVEYCSGPEDLTAHQLKLMIRALHQAGMEVWMQVEYCLTGEGSDDSPRLHSLRGLDALTYYRGDRDAVMNCGHAVVRDLVVKSLRHWAQEYQLDGFCFLNAENLTQDRDGLVQDAPPLVEQLAYDPVLSGIKLVAYVSDSSLLPRNGERGFPHWARWMEWNSRFRSEVFQVVVENVPGLLSGLATRLTGSADLFAARWDGGLPGGLAAGRRPGFGVNSPIPLGVGSLLSYLDPSGTNVDQAEVLARTLLLLSVLSPGIPAVQCATLSHRGLWRFLNLALRFRQQYRQLVAPIMLDSPRQVTYHGTSPEMEPDWSGELSASGLPGSNFLGYSMTNSAFDSVYVGINPHPEAVEVVLPAPQAGIHWRRVIDTSQLLPDDITLEQGVTIDHNYSYLLGGKAALVLEGVKQPGFKLPSSPPSGPEYFGTAPSFWGATSEKGP